MKGGRVNAQTSAGSEANSGGLSDSRSLQPDSTPAQSFDAEAYKVAKRQEWNDVAPSVGRWWRIVYEAPLVPVTNRMIELA